jgi:hypothetical protein
MNSIEWLLLILVGVAMTGLLVQLVIGTLRLRGTRLVTCPEARETTAVELAAGRSALSVALGEPNFRLKDCTRWPLREDCAQLCLAQIEKAPANCLLANVLKSWYQGKVCRICGREFGDIQAWDHKPALLDSDGRTWRWDEFLPETIPTVLVSHEPVCWDCHVTATAYRLFPDRIVERPDGWQKMSSLYK